MVEIDAYSVRFGDVTFYRSDFAELLMIAIVPCSSVLRPGEVVRVYSTLPVAAYELNSC